MFQQFSSLLCLVFKLSQIHILAHQILFFLRFPSSLCPFNPRIHIVNRVQIHLRVYQPQLISGYIWVTLLKKKTITHLKLAIWGMIPQKASVTSGRCRYLRRCCHSWSPWKSWSPGHWSHGRRRLRLLEQLLEKKLTEMDNLHTHTHT